MKKNILFATTLLAAALPALAQAESIACKYTSNAGLRWQDGSWQTTNFSPEAPFILEIRDGQLTPETAMIVLGVNRPEAVNCLSDSFGDGTCRDDTGGAFYLNHNTLHGAAAQMYGGGMVEESRDDVYVATFECVKM